MGVARPGVAVAALLALALLSLGCAELTGHEDVPASGAASADAAGAGRPEEVPADAVSAIVDRVVDGDTLHVIVDPGSTVEGGGAQRVRLLNIDAPELARDGHPAQCLAEAATARLATLLPSSSLVWLAPDREDRDRFDRPLRGLWTADGTFVNALLAEEGLAEAVLFPPNDRFHAVVAAAERRATEAGRGIHGAGCR